MSRRYMQGLYGGIPIVGDAEVTAALGEVRPATWLPPGDLTEQEGVSPS